MMDEADAMSELNEKPSDSIDALAAKYESSDTDVDVDDELAALKAEMGM
jgi:phage shock protein A